MNPKNSTKDNIKLINNLEIHKKDLFGHVKVKKSLIFSKFYRAKTSMQQ